MSVSKNYEMSVRTNECQYELMSVSKNYEMSVRTNECQCEL